MQGDRAAGIQLEPYGILPCGRPATRYTLANRRGLTVKILDFGGIITELHAPDRGGRFTDIVLGYDTLQEYVDDRSYFGALIGRFANRIADSQFVLDGRRITLPANDGAHHLHGGPQGYDKVLWTAEPISTDGRLGLALRYHSRAGEQGYPGALDIYVLYELDEENGLTVSYRALCDAPTPVNLTQHTYFNLAGGGDILSHLLWLNADAFIPIDPTAIPLGAIAPVEGTPFDFRAPRPIGQRIDDDHAQLRNGRGYDHSFVINNAVPGSLCHAATLHDPASGRVMEIHTEEPGLQFYSGNFLDGRPYAWRSGLCLEPAHFPDSPNQPGFPDVVLRPGRSYSTQTKYVFGSDTETLKNF